MHPAVGPGYVWVNIGIYGMYGYVWVLVGTSLYSDHAPPRTKRMTIAEINALNVFAIIISLL